MTALALTLLGTTNLEVLLLQLVPELLVHTETAFVSLA